MSDFIETCAARGFILFGRLSVFSLLMLGGGWTCLAGTHFVSTNGAHHTPFATWEDAATNIMDAVNVATNGETVWVSNGVYYLQAQITLAKAIVLRSVNGSANTVLDGRDAVRCLYLDALAVVDGFTLTHGRAGYGGGAYLYPGTTVRNCVIVSNTATANDTCGGGVYLFYGGTLLNCLVRQNSGKTGAGVCICLGGTVESCTIVENTAAVDAGGLHMSYGEVANSIIVSNTAGSRYPDVYQQVGGTWSHSCSPGLNAPGCITHAPDFVSPATGDFRLRDGSPCMNTGLNSSWMTGAQDLDGRPRLVEGNVDMGAYEVQPAGFVAEPAQGLQPLQVVFTANITLTNMASPLYAWDFQNDGTVDADGENNSEVTHVFDDTGCYSVGLTVSNAEGEVQSVVRSNCIEVALRDALRCSFTSDVVVGDATLSCVFSAQVAGSVTQGIWYAWDFNDDGVIDSHGFGSRVATNSYEMRGDYAVSLTVSNVDNEVATTTRTDYIHVTPLNILASPAAGKEPLDVVFTATSSDLFLTGNYYAWWDFNNDGVIELEGPSLFMSTNRYDQAGVYSVALVVSNEVGQVYRVLKSDFIPVSYRDYYVNDTNLAGDVYCTAPGNTAHDGLTPDAPKASIQEVLDAYDLGPGDVIYTDTGWYSSSNGVVVSGDDAGSSGDYFTIQGSTNRLAGGTILTHPVRSSGATVLSIQVPYVKIADVTVTNGSTGISIASPNVMLSQVRVNQCAGSGVSVGAANAILYLTEVWGCGGNGVEGGGAALFQNCLVTRNGGYGFRFEGSRHRDILKNCTITGNANKQIYMWNSDIGLYDSIVVATNGLSCIYQQGGSYQGDYNDLYPIHGGNTAGGQDLHSFYVNPLFADPTNGDYHVLSAAGRYVAPGVWTNDSQSSSAIDNASPDGAWDLEPLPHGGRRNQGAYGNTPEASKTAIARWIRAVTFSLGGTASGTNALLWDYNGIASGATVRVDYSPDDGDTWSILASGASVEDRQYLWNTALSQGSPVARWRVVLENDPSIWDVVDSSFVLRPYIVYVNDSNQVGDVYCTAIGSASNHGASSARPKDSLGDVLATYDLNGGDRVLIDTGYYVAEQNPAVTAADGGAVSNYVTIQGSTNLAAGGTTLFRSSQADWQAGLRIDAASWVQLRDLKLTGGKTALHLYRASACLISNLSARALGGVWLDESSGCQLYSLDVRGCAGRGIDVDYSSGILVRNGVICENSAWGINLVNSSATIENSTIAANGSTEQIRIYNSLCSLTLRNSILVASGTGTYGIVNNAGIYVGEFNDMYAVNGACLVKNGATYATLSDWQAASRQDLNSFSANPLFAGNGDYHVKSSAGRLLPDGTWTNDAVDSPCLDAGDPILPYAREPEPNGSKLNVGAYGNTPEASRTPDSLPPWIYVTSPNAGGNAGPTVTVQWVCGRLTGDRTVAIYHSVNAGETWTLIQAGIPGTNLQFAVSMADIPDTPTLLFKVVVESDPDIFDATDRMLVLRRGSAFQFYVNDPEQEADVYCSSIGSVSGTGLTPSSPMLDLQTLLNTYDLDAGDTVYIDTGLYPLTNSINVSSNDSGSVSAMVRFVGSTNEGAGGSVFLQSVATNSCLQGTKMEYTAWCNLVLRGGKVVMQLDGCGQCVVSNMTISGGSSHGLAILNSSWIYPSNSVVECTIRENRGYGILANQAQSILLRNNLVYTNSAGGFSYYNPNPLWARIENSTLAGNGGPQINIAASSSVRLHNSIVVGSVTGAVCVSNAGSYVGDYNDFFVTNGAKMSLIGSSSYANLIAWRAVSAGDGHSISRDPLFASTNDFHLQSSAGRYDRGSWVMDAQDSPAINAGDPASAWAREPEPNGGHVNLGCYGNTHQASKGSQPLLRVTSLNTGATVNGTVALTWTADRVASDDTVRLDYSPSAGLEWINIATQVLATSGSLEWNSALFQSSRTALWRVSLESNTNIADEADQTFILRNGAFFNFYINDTNTVGDVYCTAVGNDGLDGLTPATPKVTPQAILDTWDLEGGDTVYVDTGVYANQGIHVNDHGLPGLPVSIVGSTNLTAGGSVIDRGESSPGAYGLFLYQRRYVSVANLTFRRGYFTLYLEQSQFCVISNVVVSGAANMGVRLYDSQSNEFRNCFISNAGKLGVSAIGGSSCTRFRNSSIYRNADGGLSLEGVMNEVINCTLADNPGYQLTMSKGTVRNSIFAVSGSGQGCLSIGSAVSYRGDYNNFYALAGAVVGKIGTTTYTNLPTWKAGVGGQDLNSLDLDPRFAVPTNSDYHLKSTQGRIVGFGEWTNDAVQSPCIDRGDPADDYTAEPNPNGGRINMGAYGNTPAASKGADMAPWVRADSFENGGLLSNTVSLAWQYGDLASNAPVRIDYTCDTGLTWQVIAEHVAVGDRAVAWDTRAISYARVVKWRVMLESNPGVWDDNQIAFVIRNGPLTYYVNDTNTQGDVFCTAPGDDANTGLDPQHPKASIQAILDQHSVWPGETVYVDAGTHSITSTIVIGSDDAGGTNIMTTIRGTTNRMAGATVLRGMWTSARQPLVRIANCGGVTLRDLILETGRIAIQTDNATGCLFSDLIMRDMDVVGIETHFGGGLECARLSIYDCGRGLYLDQTDNLTLRQSVIHGNRCNAIYIYSSGIRLLNNTLAYNLGAQVAMERGNWIDLRNNILMATGAGNSCASLLGGITGNNNNVWASDGATRGNFPGSATLFYYDPLFVDPVHGDFHLRSSVGRWTEGGWVQDEEDSLCIDLGFIADDWSDEPLPNGERINLGAYGGTAEASLSRTNVRLVVANDLWGQSLCSSSTVRWLVFNANTNDTVCLEYSPDNGGMWNTFASGVAAADQEWRWDTMAEAPGAVALWRIVLERQPSVRDTIDGPFMVHSGPLTFYVNDNNLDGDLYSSTVGNDTNLGVRADAPKATVQSVLVDYDLEGGDRILVDNGTYDLTNSINVGVQDSGTAESYVTIQGCTNPATMGTVWNVTTNVAGISIVKAIGIRIADMTVDGGFGAIFIRESRSCVIQNVQALNGLSSGITLFNSVDLLVNNVWCQNNLHGIYALSCLNSELRHSVICKNRENGIDLIWGTWRVVNNTLGFNAHAQLSLDGHQCWATNNILFAATAGSLGISWIGGTYLADFNDFYAASNATLGYVNLKSPLVFSTLADWRQFSGQDNRSISLDPRFVDAQNDDYHLQSAAATGTYVNSLSNWAQFAQDSPCIDTGNPVDLCDNEPSWNGSRINIGAYGGGPFASRSRDTDGDLLSDTAELYDHGTLPDNSDSDGDTLGDRAEVMTYQTDPMCADTDNDRLTDDQEVLVYFTDTRQPDTDYDGMLDGDEIIAGTSPTNFSQCFRITSQMVDPVMGLRFSWDSSLGRYYSVFERGMSATDEWLVAEEFNHKPGTGFSMTYTNEVPSKGCMYRVKVER